MSKIVSLGNSNKFETIDNSNKLFVDLIPGDLFIVNPYCFSPPRPGRHRKYAFMIISSLDSEEVYLYNERYNRHHLFTYVKFVNAYLILNVENSIICKVYHYADINPKTNSIHTYDFYT